MKPGGRLLVSVRVEQMDDASVAVIFADQGVGIRADDLPKIFEPGFTTVQGSPGLGLAVTRKVVEQHGGTIQVRSLPGQGTTFTLALPLAGQLSDREVLTIG
jgi:signal transduction histidine kinase